MPGPEIRRRLVLSLAASLCLHLGNVAGQDAGTPRSSSPPDSVLASAERALADGRPWRATLLLAPLLRTPSQRTPPRVLAGARAAAGWEGWSLVGRLLSQESWLDSLSNGEGRALLARSLVERGQGEDAVAPAARAVAIAPDRETHGARLVLLARALDRAGDLDSAAATYLRAAGALPLVEDWLRLRAAGVTLDSAARAAMLERIESAPSRLRIPWTDAQARERAGDAAGAARAYERLGARVTAARLKLTVPDTALRRETRAELLRLIGGGGGAQEISADDAMEAIALLDHEFPGLTPAEELVIARRASGLGLSARAAHGYARAGERLLSDRDRFHFGLALLRLNRYSEARAQFGRVKGKDLRGLAAFQRARAWLQSGRLATAVRALGGVARLYPDDMEAASSARFLAAGLLADRRQDDSARAAFTLLARRYPRSPYARRARFQAAVIALVRGNARTAAQELDALADGWAEPEAEEAYAGLYWAGRARETLGDSAGARRRWRELVARGRQARRESFYVLPATARLGLPAWEPPDATGSTAPGAVLDPALERAALLTRLGMKVEARFEEDALAASAAGDPLRLLVIARSFVAARMPGRALRLAQRARERGAPLDRELARLLYPLPDPGPLRAEAAAAELDPYLIAGLMRQESAFDPQARSVANARGLMQVLPSVGARLARAAGMRDWDPVLLYQPDVNIAFGVKQLAQAFRRYQHPIPALAAYNAGNSRAEHWLTLGGAQQDLEVFLERIPFVETRDYVRRVLQNQAYYRILYGEQ